MLAAQLDEVVVVFDAVLLDRHPEGRRESDAGVQFQRRLAGEGCFAGVLGSLAQQQRQTNVLADAAFGRVLDGKKRILLLRWMRRGRRRRGNVGFDVIVDDDRVSDDVVVDVHDVVVDVVDDDVVSAVVGFVADFLGVGFDFRRFDNLDDSLPGLTFPLWTYRQFGANSSVADELKDFFRGVLDELRAQRPLSRSHVLLTNARVEHVDNRLRVSRCAVGSDRLRSELTQFAFDVVADCRKRFRDFVISFASAADADLLAKPPRRQAVEHGKQVADGHLEHLGAVGSVRRRKFAAKSAVQEGKRRLFVLRRRERFGGGGGGFAKAALHRGRRGGEGLHNSGEILCWSLGFGRCIASLDRLADLHRSLRLDDVEKFVDNFHDVITAIFADGWRHLLTDGAVEVKDERFLIVVCRVSFQILHHDLTDLAFQWVGLLFRCFFVIFTLNCHLQAVHLTGRRKRGRGGAATADAAAATFSAATEPQICANLLRCNMDVLFQSVKYGVNNRID